MKRYSWTTLALALLLAGCATPPRDTLYQTSTIDALLAGVYDGDLACGRLLKHGDFGIGTFDKLDGEMILLDGTVYQVKADGRVHRPSPATLTPFAAVCRFTPEQTVPIGAAMDLNQVEAAIDQALVQSNHFQAIRITGRFKTVKTRSVPAQAKPYRPLKEVTANQPVFPMESIEGTIVGFRCPPYVAGLNVPGYHLHFISADRTRGGHVLAFEMEPGAVHIDTLNQFFLRLPEQGSAFSAIDLAKDREAELKTVEK
jgi:acetolactate decarboxylase